MKNHELLDLMGEVDEKYVLAAEETAARPRLRWKGWAAAAACVALIAAAAAYPGTVADHLAPEESREPLSSVIQRPGLHEYTLIEGGGQALTTQGKEIKAPGGGGVDNVGQGPEANAGAPDIPEPDPSSAVKPPDPDEPVIDQDEAIQQYQNLLQNGGIGYGGEGYYPEWFAGAWLDNDWPDNVSRLTVAIVDDYRTPAIESQVKAWCGGTGDVLFCGAKYSYAYLNGLMDEISAVFDRYGWLSSAFAANVMTNRVELDIFAMPSDEFLADLARLDPDGDAIRVQVFTDGSGIRFTDDVWKGPEPGTGPVEPVPDMEREQPAQEPVEPDAEPSPTPVDWSGVSNEADAGPNGAREAQYDTLPRELPEKRYDAPGAGDGLADYDIIYGADE